MEAVLNTEYGKIVIPEDIIANIAGYAAVENYGIVGMKGKTGNKGLIALFVKDNLRRGVKITLVDDSTVGVDLYVTLEYGVSLPAVSKNTRDNVKYRVENLLELKVQFVNIHVEGVRT